MNDENIDYLVLNEGKYIVENMTTIRKCAKYFGISKSTVHTHIHKKLKYLDFFLYDKVLEVLEYNYRTKHIRGGIATKNKYSKN